MENALRRASTLLALMLLTLPIAGCELIGDLLEFGFWVLVILVLLLVLAVWGLKRAFTRRGDRPVE